MVISGLEACHQAHARSRNQPTLFNKKNHPWPIPQSLWPEQKLVLQIIVNGDFSIFFYLQCFFFPIIKRICQVLVADQHIPIIQIEKILSPDT